MLGSARAIAVGYRIPVIDLLRTDREHDIVGGLGPDLLGPDWDPAEAERRLRERPDRDIGEALLDQRNLAGVGNLYKAETLFLMGITPWTPVRDVTTLERTIALAQQLMIANRDHGHQVTTGSRRRGEEHWVYGRAGRPCRRCGTPVRRAVQGPTTEDRVSFWCPSCQAGPAPTAAASRPA